MRVAIVHDWFTVYGGAERVIEQIVHLYPHADIFSLIDFLPKDKKSFILNKTITTSFIQNLPFASKFYRYYLPLMPLAIEQFNLNEYDLIISSSTAVAKGVITGPDQLHICYCNSPMRYIWDLQFQYLKEAGYEKGLKKWLFSFYIKKQLHHLRNWDFRTAQAVDAFIGNSEFVVKRINKYYRRQAVVIYPPVDTDFFSYCQEKEDFYVTASRLVPYKKVDLIAQAFAQMPDKKLVIIGDGPEWRKIEHYKKNNITMIGALDGDSLRSYLQRAKAFVFAAVEDFGIAPLEAQACGTPVICYAKGGTLETICGLDQPNPTGCFYREQTPAALISAIELFEKNQRSIHSFACRNNALAFSIGRFREQFKQFVEFQNESIDSSRRQRDALMAAIAD